jgi:hypothetical protein
MMKHVCDYGVWDAPLEGGAFKMRPRRRRKALASLLGFATRTRPQAPLGASPKQWLSLARTSNAALRPSADVREGGERRPEAAANAKTRLGGVARLAPIDIGAAPRALHPSRLGRNALRVSSS